jgi:hypothetical protein
VVTSSKVAAGQACSRTPLYERDVPLERPIREEAAVEDEA